VQALRELAARHSGKITLLKLDVSDEDSICAAVQAVNGHIGASGLNLLINNAAVNKPAAPAKLCDTSKKDMMDVYNTNMAGPFLLAKMFLPLLQRAADTHSPGKGKGDEMSCRRSAIINISTFISSIQKCPETFHFAHMYPYRTSKAALNMLTRCLAEDFKKNQILVTGLHPGWVQTDMGGKHAPLTTQESVLGMLSVMSSLSSKDSGMLLDWEGNRIPW
ncbi:hypothetical protein LDENG_00122970, partial [Lucifuga dentata]